MVTVYDMSTWEEEQHPPVREPNEGEWPALPWCEPRLATWEAEMPAERRGAERLAAVRTELSSDLD